MILYKQLKSKYKEDNIPYFELLNTKEWNDCREEILTKYNGNCFHCGVTVLDELVEIPLELAEELKVTLSRSFKRLEEKINKLTKKLTCNIDGYSSCRMKFPRKLHKYKNLDIHHQYYILSKLPWEYPEALIPLCRCCHEKEHKIVKIRVYEYSSEDKVYGIADNCPRCRGLGVIDQYQYYMNGICFACDGVGFVEI